MASSNTKYEGIFGTPPEPLFNVKPSCMTKEILEEWLIVLAAENTENLTKSGQTECYFKTSTSAEFVFLTCDYLKLPPEAKYLAIELFDRFMMHHVRDLFKHVMKISKTNREQDWQNILQRIKNQVLLRVVSCCQLASKLTSHHHMISPKKACNTLIKFGHRYSKESILQSELRVLKTLDYKVMLTTPLVYIETLLEILGHNHQSLAVKTYHGVSLKILDLIYMRRTDIYDRFLQVRKNCPSLILNGLNPDAIKSNYLLLGVTIISAATYIVDQRNLEKVTDAFNKITLIPSGDILEFATVVVQLIVESSERYL